MHALKERGDRARHGFTLVEMLIVIAIIAALIAIAVPAFNAQTTQAKIATDNANLRAAQETAYAQFMDGEHSGYERTAGWFYENSVPFYGYFFDPGSGMCLCDGNNVKAGRPVDAQSLRDHGYGQTPSLRKKTGGSSYSHVDQFIYVAISTDGTKMLAGWTYHGFNFLYVDVLPDTYMNPDDYVL